MSARSPKKSTLRGAHTILALKFTGCFFTAALEQLANRSLHLHTTSIEFPRHPANNDRVPPLRQ